MNSRWGYIDNQSPSTSRPGRLRRLKALLMVHQARIRKPGNYLLWTEDCRNIRPLRQRTIRINNSREQGSTGPIVYQPNCIDPANHRQSAMKRTSI